MKEFQYTVKDACGIHARPAGLLVKVAKGFASTATLEKAGKTCDLRKLMALMGMGVKQGDTVTIKVEGRRRGRLRRSDPEIPERERLIAQCDEKPLRGMPAGAFCYEDENDEIRRKCNAGRHR